MQPITVKSPDCYHREPGESCADYSARAFAEMEQALASNWSPDAVAGITVDASGLLGDIHGSAEYRANLVTVMAKRAVAAA